MWYDDMRGRGDGDGEVRGERDVILIMDFYRFTCFSRLSILSIFYFHIRFSILDSRFSNLSDLSILWIP